MAKMRQLPGFVDVNTDMQIASPQVMVDIDRDRAQALGVTPEQVQDALFSAFGTRQVSVIYAPADQYSGDPGGGPAIPAHAGCALASSTCARRTGRWFRSTPWCDMRRQTGPLSINHFGQLPAVTISFNLRPGYLAGPGRRSRWTTPSATCACRPPSAPASRAR